MNTLDRAVAAQETAQWATSAGWTADQQNAVTDHLVALSGRVVPHVVEDVPLPAADLQEYLLRRTVDRLNDWLLGAAATLRAGYGFSAPRLTNAGIPGLGLRSASRTELTRLRGIDDDLALGIGRYLSEHPASLELSDLLDVRGVGPARLAELDDVAYLERPRLGLLSATLWKFLSTPSVETFLPLLAKTDLFIWFGDENSARRYIKNSNTGTSERFLSFLTLVSEQAERSVSVADAVTTSDAAAWLMRHTLARQIPAAGAPAAGRILRDSAYRQAATAALAGATTSIDVLMFLGTAAAGTPADPGPISMVDALVQAAKRGIRTRVVLDQDDGGEPYGSLFINRPLVRRLKENQVAVKLDDPLTLLHSKMVVIDATTTLVGSHNWTANSLSSTHELSMLITSPSLAQAAAARFEKIWNTLPDLPP